MSILERILLNHNQRTSTPGASKKAKRRVSNIGVYGWLVSFILALTFGCSQPTSLESIRARPRPRIGSYPVLNFTTHFLGQNLGKHSYSFTFSERNGIIYTLRGGYIDTAHLRKSIDWTAFLANKSLGFLMENKGAFKFKLYEPSVYSVEIRYSEKWKAMPDKEKREIARDISVGFGQYLAYTAVTWHEILTWYGYKSTLLVPESGSAFSWEDSFSNLLGTHIAGIVLKDTGRSYNESVTLAIIRELRNLGVQSKENTIEITRQIEGKWYSVGFFPFSGERRRNFDIGLDGYVEPMLVDLGLMFGEIEPKKYPVPTLDFLSEYGLSARLVIEPRELNRGRILEIIYPNRGGSTIEPSRDFDLIMKDITNSEHTAH